MARKRNVNPDHDRTAGRDPQGRFVIEAELAPGPDGSFGLEPGEGLTGKGFTEFPWPMRAGS